MSSGNQESGVHPIEKVFNAAPVTLDSSGVVNRHVFEIIRFLLGLWKQIWVCFQFGVDVRQVARQNRSMLDNREVALIGLRQRFLFDFNI